MIRLLLFLALVVISHQYDPCLATAKNQRLNNGYSFALAKVVQDVTPQEACHFSCGARLVTHSHNVGDMKHLTAVDKAIPYLGVIGFLKTGQSYFVNHLGASDKEGGNGLGCIYIQSEKKTKRYPKSHPVCLQAESAICGFWGQQSIPNAPEDTPSTPQPSSPAKPNPSVSKPKPSVSKPKPSVVKPKPSTARPQPSSSAKPSDGKEGQFEMDGKRYSILKQGQDSLLNAKSACSRSQYKLGAIGSINMYDITQELLQNKIKKVIVGSWNGDDYSLHGSSCLILDARLGIFPGICSDADAILCQHF
ncbi:unnamed protein product [Rhizopus stolonifer]